MCSKATPLGQKPGEKKEGKKMATFLATLKANVKRVNGKVAAERSAAVNN